MRSPTHQAALDYAARGWYVFPVEPPRAGDPESGKRPLGALVPNGKDDATVDPTRINAWWSRAPDANVAIALEPSGLIVLDVDVGLKKDGTPKEGKASLEALEADGAVDMTTTAITGGGGLHALYKRGDLEPVQRLGFRPGLDLIGKGYIVAAPSLHYSGKKYRWNDTREPVPVPAKLYGLTKQKSPAESKPVDSDAAPLPEGKRNASLFALGCALRDQGIGLDALKTALHFENQRRCNPPLPDDEVLLLAESVYRRVTPMRDAALGAAIAAEAVAAIAPPPARKAISIAEASRIPAPPARFYSTGFGKLDALMGGGLCTRQVCGVIGPPSAGKSGFVKSVMRTVQRERPVLHISTELPRHELVVRYGAQQAGVVWRDALKGSGDVGRVYAEAARLENLYLIGCDDLDINDPLDMIAREAVSIANERGQMPVLVVDYVQLLARGSEDQVRSKVGSLTMGLRVMTQVLDTAMMAVFSTARSFYAGGGLEKLRTQNDPLAYLSAAKESGDIEYDCATILFVDVDQLHEGQPKPTRTAVSRCRVGDIGFVGMRANLATGVFEADDNAAALFSSETRRAAQASDRVEKDAERIVDLLKRMPNRPWREVREAMGGGVARADAARAWLLERNKVTLVDEVYYDALQRKQKRVVLKLTGEGNTPLLGNL